jgi:hypothetical protein
MTNAAAMRKNGGLLVGEDQLAARGRLNLTQDFRWSLSLSPVATKLQQANCGGLLLHAIPFHISMSRKNMVLKPRCSAIPSSGDSLLRCSLPPNSKSPIFHWLDVMQFPMIALEPKRSRSS